VGQAQVFEPRTFPLGRPWLKDERRRNLAIQKSEAEATPLTADMKTRKGVG